MGQDLNYSVEILAPRERVWEQMLGEAGYRDWTAAFCEGSTYQGRWETGADMLFLGPSGDGMRARIELARAPEAVSIQHLGELAGGAPKEGSDWQGVFERYHLLVQGGGTRLEVELTQVPQAYVEMMNTMWPVALQRLKQACEA
ncbi:SRPBCC domain-containing protein [Inhella gelatinilytica]|uniref:SRPBCC domain-containing protein n=1 Tax=Inhella gelatinilytica TaxID=2795030 RepID=A0A931IXA2_9BURK|nr:SRPBCC domain-containing protein [Inhella gelatinilytica]MBH9551566.1 SRPBCC domain-containing protein [Inhella gelatinilytica]